MVTKWHRIFSVARGEITNPQETHPSLAWQASSASSARVDAFTPLRTAATTKKQHKQGKHGHVSEDSRTPSPPPDLQSQEEKSPLVTHVGRCVEMTGIVPPTRSVKRSAPTMTKKWATGSDTENGDTSYYRPSRREHRRRKNRMAMATIPKHHRRRCH